MKKKSLKMRYKKQKMMKKHLNKKRHKTKPVEIKNKKQKKNRLTIKRHYKKLMKSKIKNLFPWKTSNKCLIIKPMSRKY